MLLWRTVYFTMQLSNERNGGTRDLRYASGNGRRKLHEGYIGISLRLQAEVALKVQGIMLMGIGLDDPRI